MEVKNINTQIDNETCMQIIIRSVSQLHAPRAFGWNESKPREIKWRKEKQK